MKTYTIKINNSNNGINFRNNTASKSLDDLILTNLKKMNPYLGKHDDTLDAMFSEAGFGKNDRIIISNRDNDCFLKDNFDTEFIEAAKFLSDYTPSKTTYILSDGSPIGFFEDEIQIGTTLIPLYKLRSPKYYSTFEPNIKNLIINLFISINR